MNMLASTKTELITEIMPELLDEMIQAAHQHHLKIGQYSDSGSIQDYIELHFKDEIIRNIKSRVYWEDWLVVELAGEYLRATADPKAIKAEVRDQVDSQIWYACWEGGTFAAEQYIDYQCRMWGYLGEPESDDYIYNAARG